MRGLSLRRLFVQATLVVGMSLFTNDMVAQQTPANQNNDSQPEPTETTAKQDTIHHSLDTHAYVHASQKTLNQYGHALDCIVPYFPNANYLIVTIEDLSPKDTTYQNYEWYNFISCERDTTTRMSDSMKKIHLSVQGYLSSYIDIIVGRQKPFVTVDELKKTKNEMLEDYNAVLQSVSYAALMNQAACMSLTAHLQYVDSEASIVILPSQFEASKHYIYGFSGVHPSYLKPLPGTHEDLKKFVIAHEFAHGYYNHTSDIKDMRDLCDTLRTDYLYETWIHEGTADAAGAIVMDMLWDNQQASTDSLPEAVEALRALGTFYFSANSLSIQHTRDVNDHVSTIVYDPQNDTTCLSSIDISQTPEMVTMPSVINTYADILSGFMYLQDMKQQVELGDTSFTEEDILYYQSISSKTDSIEWYADFFAQWGQDLRMKMNSPEYHYASMKYLKKSGTFEALRDLMDEPYKIVFDDLISDFFKGVEHRGRPALKNPELYVRYEEVLGPHYDFSYVTSQVLGLQEVPEVVAPVELPALDKH